jgi:ketopantoate reductase
MKLCVFGAGAIGGHLAARLALVHGTAATSAGCSASLGQMAAFGREVGVAGVAGVAGPTIDMLLALVRGLDRMRRTG